MKTFKVQYQIATYSGIVLVDCNEGAESEHIIGIAKSQLLRRAGGSFPLGCERFEIISK